MKKWINAIKNKIILLCQYIDNQWNDFINQKYIKFAFTFLPKNLFVFFIFIVSIFTFKSFYQSSNSYTSYSQTSSDSTVGPIINKELEINLHEKKVFRNTNKICLALAKYNPNSSSVYYLNIFKNKEKIQTIEIDSKDILNNQKNCYSVDEIPRDEISEYDASLVPSENVNSSNAITAFKDSSTNELTLYLNYVYSNFSIKDIILIIYIVIFFIINYFINRRNISLHGFWIILCVLYIIPICFIYPPYQVPDEPLHFYNSYRLSQIDYSLPLNENMENNTIEVPKSINCLDYSNYNYTNKVSNINDVISCINNSENTTNELYKVYNYRNSKLGYIFSAVGIFIADIFTKSSLFIFYLGRLFNLLLSIICIYFILKKVPKYGKIFMLVATIPMFIQEMVSYSYDSILNLACLISMATILYYSDKEKINWYILTLVLLICGTFIVNIKMIYLTIFLALLIIPTNKFKKSYIKILYCFLMILVSFVLGRFSQIIFIGNSSLNYIGNNFNLNYIISNPMYSFVIGYNTIKKLGVFYLSSLIGYFGWFSFKINDIFILFYFGCFLFTIFYNDKFKYKVKKYNRILIIIGILFSICCVFAALYFGCSRDGINYVEGVQGRYFLPLLVPLAICFISDKSKRKIGNNYLYYFVNVILLQYVLILISHFY